MLYKLSSPISSNIHRYFNNTSREFKVQKRVTTTETFNVDFQDKFIIFGLFGVFFSIFRHTVGFIFLIYVHTHVGIAYIPMDIISYSSCHSLNNIKSKSKVLIVTAPRCKGERNSFLWIAPLYPWCVPYNTEVSSTIFRVFGMTRTGFEPRTPGPLVNTLIIFSLWNLWK